MTTIAVISLGSMGYGINQGVTPGAFMNVIPECAGTSWMLENREPHIVNGDYTPHSSVNIWPKDLGIVLDIAKDAKFAAQRLLRHAQHSWCCRPFADVPFSRVINGAERGSR
jgi:3-hydroxyisobutyrate dehydrogenase-like beta-hydroxyacid dehydrogenase